MGVEIVRVDGTFGKDPLGPPGGRDKAQRPPGAAAPRADEKETDRIVSSSLAPLIRRASEADEVNSQAVREAKKALQAGELDTPEAAQRAAKNILDVGLY